MRANRMISNKCKQNEDQILDNSATIRLIHNSLTVTKTALKICQNRDKTTLQLKLPNKTDFYFQI